MNDSEFYPKQAICKVCERDRKWKTRYHITPEEYLEMYNKQNGVCAICGQPETNGKLLAVDHDHGNGKIRGLLCSKCNKGLAHFNDATLLLRKAMIYLNKNKEE